MNTSEAPGTQGGAVDMGLNTTDQGPCLHAAPAASLKGSGMNGNMNKGGSAEQAAVLH